MNASLYGCALFPRGFSRDDAVYYAGILRKWLLMSFFFSYGGGLVVFRLGFCFCVESSYLRALTFFASGVICTFSLFSFLWFCYF